MDAGSNDGRGRSTSSVAVSNVGDDSRPRSDDCLSRTAGQLLDFVH